LAAVYRYRDADQVRRNLGILASAGIIEQTDGGAIRATGTVLAGVRPDRPAGEP
jgi:hypothetical protein